MSIIDISIRLDETTPIWPTSYGYRDEWVKRISAGDSSNNSIIKCDTHIGTHVDAPLHFMDKGASIEEIPLNLLCGRAFVTELKNISSIGEKELEAANIPKGVERVILKTANSRLWKDRSFNPDFVALTEDGAARLIEMGVRLIGIDYLSVGPYPDGTSVHRLLLEKDIAIVEGLDLSNADPGWYDLICLPLKMVGTEGAPARAILLPMGETTI